MNGKSLPIIFPTPKEISYGDGYYKLEKDSIIIGASGLPEGKALKLEHSADLQDEEYLLSISDEGIKITSKNDKGAKLAFQTIRQLAMQNAELPHLQIRDYPDLKTRGFMLDISRCKVLNMDTLLYLTDMLALFKYNRLELYTEHTFAFRNHETVWANSSPMTAKEYEILGTLCARMGIELVPNLNSLGHFDRWLRHPEYNHLAESKAPFIDIIGTLRPYPTTLHPDDNAVAFMDSLYAQFLPLFSSDKVNIGCDEPWEFGLGKSKERCEKDKTKYLLYIEYVSKLSEAAKKYGKKCCFWADVLMKDSQYAKILPESMIPILWGYYEDHPFKEECSCLQNYGREFLIAPGTSTWNSFAGRWHNAMDNIKSACENAKEYDKCLGTILTNWGDNGNHQIFCSMWLPTVFFAQSAWSQTCTEEDAIEAVSEFIFKDKSQNFAKALAVLGKVDPIKKLFCLYNKLFFGTPKEIDEILSTNTYPLDLIKQQTQEALDLLALSTMRCPDANVCAAELQLACDMINFALYRAKFDKEISLSPTKNSLRFIASQYSQLWLARARIGGLHESEAKIRNIAPEIFI